MTNSVKKSTKKSKTTTKTIVPNDIGITVDSARSELDQRLFGISDFPGIMDMWEQFKLLRDRVTLLESSVIPEIPEKDQAAEIYDQNISNLISLLHRGTGKTTWELVRLAIQSIANPVLYIVPFYLVETSIPSKITRVLTDLGLSDLLSLVKFDNIIQVTDQFLLGQIGVPENFQYHKYSNHELELQYQRLYDNIKNQYGIQNKYDIIFSHTLIH